MTLDAQTLLTGMGVAGVFIGVWVGIHVRLKALEVEVKQLQKNEDKNGEKFDSIMNKLEEMRESTSEKFTLMHENFRDLLREMANYQKKNL